MQVPDLANGCFELFGGVLSGLNIRRLYRDKEVRGFSPTLMAFVTLWGYWNLYYYPHLSQGFSFTGGVLLVVSNTAWLALCIYYLRHPLPTIHYGGPYEDDMPIGKRSVSLDPELQRQLRKLAAHEGVPDHSDNGAGLETIGYGEPDACAGLVPLNERTTRHEGDSRRRDR